MFEIPPCSHCKNLQRNSVFCCLLPFELETISEKKSTINVKKGEMIFREGERGNGLHCIYSGKVKIHKLGDMARDQIVRFAREGEILGYRSILSDEPYNASATALEDCSICFIPKSRFMQILSSNSELALRTIQHLAKDLREAEERMINISQKPAVERLAEALLSLERIFGRKSDDLTLNVALKRSEMGELAGMTTETTIRTLAELKRLGFIDLVGKQIQFTDYQGLANLANAA